MRRKEESDTPRLPAFSSALVLWLEVCLMVPHPQENQESEPQSANLVDLVAQLHNFHWFH